MTKLTLPSLAALEATAKSAWVRPFKVSKQDAEDIWQDAVVSFLEGETTTTGALEQFVTRAARNKGRDNERFDSL